MGINKDQIKGRTQEAKGKVKEVVGKALGLAAPHALQWQLVAWALGGLGGWTLIEYGLHRFVLHRLPPFQAMQELHHQRGHTHHYGVSTSLWDHVFRTT
jgi:hypothetical protein